MCYSIEPRERRYVKEYGFMSFARNFNDKYGKSLRNASKTFAKTAGAKPHNKDEVINGIPKERYVSPKERQKIID